VYAASGPAPADPSPNWVCTLPTVPWRPCTPESSPNVTPSAPLS
jgi:hypothetical protein